MVRALVSGRLVKRYLLRKLLVMSSLWVTLPVKLTCGSEASTTQSHRCMVTCSRPNMVMKLAMSNQIRRMALSSQHNMIDVDDELSCGRFICVPRRSGRNTMLSVGSGGVFSL